jgi:ribosomal protein S18 acetylase RimI-like enzyme
VTITRGSAADIDALEPLWLSVHHAHCAAMEELGPYVDDATSWRERRKLYAGILEKPDTFLLLVHDEDSGDLIGYALTHIVPVEDTWVADTWSTGQRIAEIESMGVLPGHRGAGIGSALLDAIDEELAARGIPDVIIGVLYGNSRARELYERRGFRPTWMYLSRFENRPR